MRLRTTILEAVIAAENVACPSRHPNTTHASDLRRPAAVDEGLRPRASILEGNISSASTRRLRKASQVSPSQHCPATRPVSPVPGSLTSSSSQATYPRRPHTDTTICADVSRLQMVGLLHNSSSSRTRHNHRRQVPRRTRLSLRYGASCGTWQ